MQTLCVFRVAAQATLVVLLSVGFAATSAAHSGGVNGLSGKDNGFYCRNCHAGGTAPTVAFDGPMTMDPGSTASFSFTVAAHSGSQIAAGLDVAASDGTLGLVEGQGTILLLGEVTHSEPKANDANGRATFEFTWQAPTTPGTYTLFGAGCSVNGNSQPSGDAAARTTYEIFGIRSVNRVTARASFWHRTRAAVAHRGPGDGRGAFMPPRVRARVAAWRGGRC